MLAAALIVACSQDLPSPAAVTSLRLLALTTPSPELLVGAGTRVTAVWYDPTPGRTLWFHWRLCPEPLDGDARDCALPAAGHDLGASMSDGVDLPSGALTLPPGSDHQDYVVYLALCPGALAVFDPALGHYHCASPEGLEAIRRVTVRVTEPLNHDPGITGAWVGDGAARVSVAPDSGTPAVQGCRADPCAVIPFGVQPSPDAAEPLSGGGAETLEASYYATAGTVDPPRVLGTAGGVDALIAHWTPPQGATAGTLVRLWVVLRDQRGGDTVTEGAVTLR